MVAMNGLSIKSAQQTCLLPAATSVVGYADSHDRATFAMVTKMKEEPMDVESLDNKEEDDIDMELPEDSPKAEVKRETTDPKHNLQVLLQRQAKFLENCRDVKVSVVLS